MNKLLLIYTGGTIGMMQDVKSGTLKPFNFKHLTKQVPELSRFQLDLHSVSFKKPIDSSNMHPRIWVELAEIIEKNYNDYDGFVILHGSDTMAYTASALSFMLENLNKPVILTGSQLPIGIIRTDGKENLITAIEIAAAKNKNGKPLVPEVAVYFEYELYRGNRTLKYNSEHFDAFQSPNYPVLAEAGVHINYNFNAISHPSNKKLQVHKNIDNDILVFNLFPGFSKKITQAVLNTPGVKAIVLHSFGAGNAPTDEWFIELLKKIIDKNVIVYNVTQCLEGRVIQGKYETSSQLQKIGVISGEDITLEAAVTKLMFLLGQKLPLQKTKNLLGINLRGEIS
ncbi:MAG TPA: type I asparaginase [Bacteroidia bacterium]|jgi:L-asparaginase|nr:type I asparaginase [Bacteroidia bacterium]